MNWLIFGGYGLTECSSGAKALPGSATGKNWRLADEVRYIQRRAAQYDARIVTLGQLLLFSTESGDAWLLNPSDQLATPLARDADALSVHIIEETDTRFAIGWTEAYQVNGPCLCVPGQGHRQRPCDIRLSDREDHPRNFKYVWLGVCPRNTFFS